MESQVLQNSCVDLSTSNDNEENSSTSSSGNSTAMTAIEELKEMYTADPNAERVSLRGRHLTQEDAEAVFTFLQKHFPRLRHLDLRDNNLHELPQDFGARLPKLVALNLLNNSFRFRNGALRTLGETLQHCPCLKSLSLSLSSPAEEQVLLAMLPRLRILNGTPLPSTRNDSEGNPASPTMQELQQFCASPSVKVLVTSSTTPTQQKNLPSVDPEVATVAPKSSVVGPRRSVKNSIRPTELPTSISDDRTDWCKLLKVNRSQVSKGSTSTSAVRSDSTSSSVVSTKTFLQQLKAVVKAFHECDSLGKTSSGSKTKLFAQLDRHVELLAQQLKRQEPEDGKTELSEAMLQTRWSLLEVCAMFGSQKVTQADAGLGNGFGMLLAMQKQLLAAMQAQQRNVQAQIQDQPATTEESPAQNQQQLKLLLDVAEGLESDLEAVQLQLQQETARREQVEQENFELKRVRSGGKGNLKTGNLRPTVTRSASTTDNLGTANPQAFRRIRRCNSEHAGFVNSNSDAIEDIRAPEVPTSTSTQNTAPPATVSVRNLSLKQLVDLINCVYASKTKYDARATTAGAPRETMEQHLYTYLNTRFGLPKLIVDYASAVWKAAEHFAHRENDAAVFVALLRNRLDEGFLEIKRKLQSALVELLRAFFSAKYPKKQGKAIAALVQSRLDGLLHEEEWRNLLTYLYEPQDSATLKRLVQQKAEKYQAAQTQRKKLATNEKPNLSLLFVDFEQVLYSYQLQGRLELLDGFRRAFEELDIERVGVINRPRFVTLARRLAPTKPESAVTTLLETLDPFNHDVITFSDAANALLPDIRRVNAKTNPTSTPQPKSKKNAM
ncbi:hypothetical protein PF005_g9386 [Phytophthora fragariae]|uniref:EF-hand domain-containing protein n=1 Tax=Phytophthora fragariae TaxID=53985 RepID=A0A6A3YCW6_9STRA|nr:hypothetical protein PF003_g3473 [Phytophthora fragariae]KAE8939727.1 hypothetical protein PF009_g10428 [Phytophthora fragariae]KAE9117458.1 hypothetical protein PF007_g9275 [Phytophthora fragariae]KAE9146737.1 hypothetical protein PF006_g8515 [Phytophthora fragariae]KAE9215572.1 hypothetical protein PF005_g9386 [Phytophthora fragariae]